MHSVSETDIRVLCQRFLDRHRGLSGFNIALIPSDQFPAPAALHAGQLGGYIRGSQTVFLLTDRFNQLAEVEQVLRHEVYGHAIIDALEPDRRNAMIQGVHQAICSDPEFRRGYTDLVVREYGGEITPDSIEEYFARVAEGKIELTLSERLIAIVRQLIRSTLEVCGLNKGTFPFNDVDVRHFLKTEISRIAKGEHQLSSKNSESLKRNQGLLIRLAKMNSSVQQSARSAADPEPSDSQQTEGPSPG